MKYSLSMTVLAIFVSGAIIFATRLFPFAAFSKKNPPAIIRFIEKFIPQAIMAVLVIYCFKDVNFSSAELSLPYFICAAMTVTLHLLFKNSMVSIFTSTVAFMILSRIM
jgi:branched-subunit amino acid transport protein AzlD